MQKPEIREILKACNFSVDEIEFYKERDHIFFYLLDGKYILKISTKNKFNSHMSQKRVQSLQFVHEVHFVGSLIISDRKYNYLIADYVQGIDLWHAAQDLTDKEKYEVGKDIVCFLSQLHSITNDYYDIGHYTPTVPKYNKSWQEGHLEYLAILKNGLSKIDIDLNNQKIISQAFDYIYENLDVLKYQAGAKLLHNDLHPQNIIVHEGRVSGIIDWECSQFGEADFELAHFFHWCIYPSVQENKLAVLLKYIVKDLSMPSKIPNFEKRMTIYQLEHDLNQLIWNGKKREAESIHHIKEWLLGRVGEFLC